MKRLETYLPSDPPPTKSVQIDMSATLHGQVLRILKKRKITWRQFLEAASHMLIVENKTDK